MMDARELRHTLRSKLGADEDRQSHHVYFFINRGGHDYRVGKLSHSMRGQIPDFVLADTARRLKLNRQELILLVDCPLDRDRFYQLWDCRDH